MLIEIHEKRLHSKCGIKMYSRSIKETISKSALKLLYYKNFSLHEKNIKCQMKQNGI